VVLSPGPAITARAGSRCLAPPRSRPPGCRRSSCVRTSNGSSARRSGAALEIPACVKKDAAETDGHQPACPLVLSGEVQARIVAALPCHGAKDRMHNLSTFVCGTAAAIALAAALSCGGSSSTSPSGTCTPSTSVKHAGDQNNANLSAGPDRHARLAGDDLQPGFAHARDVFRPASRTHRLPGDSIRSEP